MRTSYMLLVASLVLVAARHAGAEYREMTVTNGGRLTGQVRVNGEVPVLPPQPVFKHQELCGKTMPDERLIVGKNKEVRNAVVYLTGISAGKPIPRDRAVTLGNAKCAFVPHVLNASVGQMLEIHNSDPFLHDAQALLGPRTLFNVAVPKGQTVRKPLAYAGLVDINCTVRHTWMHAYLYVGDNPYHAVTGADGRFQIDDIPPGTYTLTVWHEMLGSADHQVSVESGKTDTVEVELHAGAAEAP